MAEPIRVSFHHGLGDCVYFAHQLAVYCQRGHTFEIACAPDKAFIFADCGPGVTVRPGATGFPHHSWEHGPSLEDVEGGTLFLANKAACNFSRPPMPPIGLIDEGLWREFCHVRLDLSRHLAAEDRDLIERFVADLPRPLVLLHTKGNAVSDQKNLDDDSTRALYTHLLEHLGTGTFVLLDWDQRVPKVAHGRFRHLLDDFQRLTVAQTYALIHEADLLIGIDSGPAHLARFTATPSLVTWFRHYPSQYMLPDHRTLHLVPKAPFHRWNIKFRPTYHLIEAEGERVPGALIGDAACRLLRPPRYLDATRIAADVKLQHHIDRLTHGGWCGNDGYNDRHRSFDLIARHLTSLGRPFRFVETGTIRAREDWRGAGFSTYLFGELAHLTGSEVISVDIEPTRCAFARIQTSPFAGSVSVVPSDSVAYLRDYSGGPIDTLYLDSLDTTSPGHAEHALAETRHGAPHVAPGGLLVIDDTHRAKGTIAGKGALAVPWLVAAGWEILHSGHQIALRKPPLP
ncbi:MAG: class I SAM-dependent methyltransferase [Verrucomicrobiales bacterium]|nr:class I SAM-dependent methyltransferase [Verrucomicrobiales bacterium]